MERQARNAFVLLTIVFVFALQCDSVDVSTTTTVKTEASNNSASGLPTTDPTPVSSTPSSANVTNAVSTSLNTHLVEIEVYYEVLSLESGKFVSNQLLPTFNKLGNFINVTFIPFAQGNITTNPDNSLNITCEKIEECNADRIHACGINKIKESQKLIEFVNCSLNEGYSSPNKTVPIYLCGKNSNLSSAVITDIINCANSTDSNPWLKDYANKFSAAHVKSVPKVLINKNSTEVFTSTVPFMNAVCKQIPVQLIPEVCKTVPSGSNTLVVGVLPIIIGAFYFIKMI